MKIKRLTGAWLQRPVIMIITATPLLCLMPLALAAELLEACYPASISKSEGGTES